MITIGYSTRKSNPEFFSYLKKSCGNIKNIEIIEKINDGEKSLSEVYNEVVNESTNDIILLCHDDIYVDTTNWVNKLIRHFKESDYGVLGVAGTTDIPVSGRWWEDQSKMVGIVNHEHQGKKWESKYCKSWGKDITQVCLIDGLFIALDKNKIKKRFNEEVSGFHFYDVTFSTENYLEDVKIGVIYDIRVTHKSIGQTNDKWEENRIKFVDTFKENLPIKFVPEITQSVKKDITTDKVKYNLVINTGENIENCKTLIDSVLSFDLKNLKISLIVKSEQLENYRFLEDDSIKIFEGYFDELIKNLSILKWENEFVSSDDQIIVFTNENCLMSNNIFNSSARIVKNNQGNFGCMFPLSLNEDGTIFSSLFGLGIRNNKISITLKDTGSYYNINQGFRQHVLGNLSDVFVTTYSNLVKNDWFDIGYESNLSFNDFAIKCFLNKKSIFVDSDSTTTQVSFGDLSKYNNDLNKLMSFIYQNENTKNLIPVYEN